MARDSAFYPRLRSPPHPVGNSSSDTGIGTADDQHRLNFEPFTQADWPSTRKAWLLGSALGAVVRRRTMS
jgi:hypothetical protein